MDRTPSRPVSRRSALSTVALGSVNLLAGCLGDEEVPDPVSLDDGQACDNCTMVIERHGGSVGQSFYTDDRPEILADRPDGVAWFCSSWCQYSFLFEYEKRGFDATGSYATDYSTVAYTIREDGDAVVISAHLRAEAVARLGELTFVVDSDVSGSMGASLIGFTKPSDAEAFAGEHSGELLAEDEITAEIIAAMGSKDSGRVAHNGTRSGGGMEGGQF